MTAFNLQDYYIGRLTETDKDANQFWLRFAQPFKLLGGDWLVRASLPINSYPAAPDGAITTGLGDFNAFAAYLIDTGDPAVSFGFGPQVTAPSATDDALGSGKWSAGFANVLFNAKSKKFQYGYLLTWQASVAGDEDRSNVNIGPFSRSSSINWAGEPICAPRRSGPITSRTTPTVFRSASVLARSFPRARPSSTYSSSPSTRSPGEGPGSRIGRSSLDSTCSSCGDLWRFAVAASGDSPRPAIDRVRPEARVEWYGLLSSARYSEGYWSHP